MNPEVNCCPRGELVVAVHTLASHYENALGAFGDDGEGRRKAEGDIAHAMKVAARHNHNGKDCAGPMQTTITTAHPHGIRPRPGDVALIQIPDGRWWRRLIYWALRKGRPWRWVRVQISSVTGPNTFEIDGP